jgi:hypothetical protein
MLAGEKVRIGYLGLTPIFSLSQAINLAAGYSSSSSFGSTFINCTMKDKHPALYALIVHYRFPPSPHKAPCMTFPNILKTMSAVKCTFSTCLNEIASTGLLQAEAGDRTLLEYVLKNAASDSPYHNLVRQIIYADSNPENFEIQGTEEALGGTAIAQVGTLHFYIAYSIPYAKYILYFRTSKHLLKQQRRPKSTMRTTRKFL